MDLKELEIKFADLESAFVQLLRSQFNLEERLAELESLIDEVLFDYQSELGRTSERLESIKTRLRDLSAGNTLEPLVQTYRTRIRKEGDIRIAERITV